MFQPVQAMNMALLSLMRLFHEAIYLNKKCSELYKYVAMALTKCWCRFMEIGTVLSGDIFQFCVLTAISPAKYFFSFYIRVPHSDIKI